MKKLLGLLLVFVAMYAIYFDLTIGTIPHSATQQTVVTTTTKPKNPVIPYFEAVVEPGETVITIVEHQLKKSLPVPITKLIADFQTLNPGQAAEKIQIGATYKFPDYRK